MTSDSNPDLGGLDIHAHFFLPSTDQEQQEQMQAFRSVCFMVTSPPTWSPEHILQYNDQAGITMQMLSYIPQDHEKLKKANDFAADIVSQWPGRFGLLAALPTDNAGVCLEEIKRVTNVAGVAATGGEGKERYVADGFALSTVYKDVGLGDSRLEPVWEELHRRQAVVHIHPNAYAPAVQGRPTPVIEVAFDTCRTVVDMLYAGVFRRWPHIKFVLGHCGGALPVLSGRLGLLGTESWVPNPQQITRAEIEEQLKRLYVDTAATARTGLGPAVQMCGMDHVVYGADCGVPCSTDKTMEENKRDVFDFEKKMGVQVGTVLRNGWSLFPAARERAVKYEHDGKSRSMNGSAK